MEKLIKDLREGKGEFLVKFVNNSYMEIIYNRKEVIEVNYETPVIQKGEYNIDPTKCSKNELIERCEVLSADVLDYEHEDYQLVITSKELLEKIGYMIDDYFLENVEELEELEKWEA
jgi:hypothetical protein